MRMSKVGVMIGCPQDIGAGGLRRYFNILPYLSRYFIMDDVSLALVPTCNSLVYSIKSLVMSGHDIDQATSLVKSNLLKSGEKCILSLEVLDRLLSYAQTITEREFRVNSVIKKRVLGFSPIRMQYLSLVDAHGLDICRRFIESLAASSVFAYSLLESYDHVLALRLLGRELGLVRSGIMLQSEPYLHIRDLLTESPSGFISSLYFNRAVASLYGSLIQDRLVRLLLSVSSAPFAISGIHKIANRYDCSMGVLSPSNAFDGKITHFRNTKSKEPIALFFTRLSPSKGLYEVPYIWQSVNKLNPVAKLWVVGSFENEIYRRVFSKLVKDLSIRNIEYLGYLSGDTLWKVVSKAKVLIYPSHRDSFSLAVLESLALGLAVVAYRIPAIESVYCGLETVSTVGEGDMKAMAMRTAELLNMSDDSFAELQEDEKTKKFLELHSSWENVAKAEYNCLRCLLRPAG